MSRRARLDPRTIAFLLLGAFVVAAVGGEADTPPVEQQTADPDVSQAPAPGPQVGVIAPQGTIGEGDQGTFRIGRTDSLGELRVGLQIGGTAARDQDFRLEGLAGSSGETVVLTLGDGQAVGVLAVDVLADLIAEGHERISLTLLSGEGYVPDPQAARALVTIPQNGTLVTTTADSGPGSLRQAILNANALEGPDTITFDSETGPFAAPQTIALERELPDLSGELLIDGRIPGRLWQATGVSVSGAGERRVFRVAEGGDIVLHGLTIADGHAATGGGVLNEGELVVKGATFHNNTAEKAGGGIANLGGSAKVINSTFARNDAGERGGGLSNLRGHVTVTNCTFSENEASFGGGLSSSGELRLGNSILANSMSASDCLSVGDLDPASTNNLIVANSGCGAPISAADPRLGPFGGYNGPTFTFPLGGGSPAINLGDNASAVDEHGEPLVWDQRGNGDPRFVGGITDIGAFEHQMLPRLTVDTAQDSGARACTRAGAADCSLRGAITLANAMGKPASIAFDANVFADAVPIMLTEPLPTVAVDLTIDGASAGGIRLQHAGAFPALTYAPGVAVHLIEVTMRSVGRVEGYREDSSVNVR